MNFLLSAQQTEMREAVLRFAAQECDSARLHRIFDSVDGHDPELWQGLMALGLGGLCIPEEYGGMGQELIDLALIAEVLGHSAMPGPFLGHSLAGLAIALAGSAKQKKYWLPRLASGSVMGTIALAEGGTVWQPEEWRVAHEARITGRKTFVPQGVEADLIIAGLAGGRLAIIEKKAAGMVVASVDGIDRTRRMAMLEFTDTPADLLPGGMEQSDRLRDAALVLLAADAFGGASRCVEMALDHARMREQFGVPIARFQALRHQLVNMAVDIEPARGLYWYAAHSWDRVPGDSARSAALAKAHLTDRYMQIARDATEAHGGIGYTWEYDLQIWFKRAMFDYAWLGAPDAHRMRAAGLAGW